MKRFLILTLLASGCATAPRTIPPPSVPVRDFINGTDFIVTEDYSWSIGNSGQAVTVPAGFVTDWASIPPSLHSVLRQLGQHNRAAVVHDWLYWSHICTREQSDNLMMIAMKELGVKKSRRKWIYRGVHLAGEAAWNANRREHSDGWPKIVPRERFAMADGMTWREARAALRKDGVRDPQFPNGLPFCALGASRDVPGGAGKRSR